MTATLDMTPNAPACPWWCTEAHDGWDEFRLGVAITKMCRRVAEADDDLDGNPVELVIERFAHIDGGRLHIGDTVIRVQCTGGLTPAGASCVGETLRRLAEITQEPGLAA